MSWFKETKKYRVAWFRRVAHDNAGADKNKLVSTEYLIVPMSESHLYTCVEDLATVESKVIYTNSDLYKSGDSIYLSTINEIFDIKLYPTMQDAIADKFANLLNECV